MLDDIAKMMHTAHVNGTQAETETLNITNIMNENATYSYKFGEEYIPEWALRYLINGEDDTLTEEDIETIKAGLESHGIKEVFPPESEAEASFTWSPMFGKACNVVLCPAEYI